MYASFFSAELYNYLDKLKQFKKFRAEAVHQFARIIRDHVALSLV